MSEYPDEKELETIEKWDPQDPWGLAEYLMDNWKYDNYISLDKRWVTKDSSYKDGHKVLHVSTAGWSGNEDRIEALKKNMFWFFWWQSSKRGGHFVFHLPRMYHPRYRSNPDLPTQ